MMLGSLRVLGDRIEHDDGLSAVLATGDMDVNALDDSRRTAATAAFARMCHTVDAPVQLVVRVRRLAPPPDAERDGRLHVLESAMRSHWADRLSTGAVHEQRVLVALRCHDAAALDAACSRATDMLRAVGVGAWRLADAQLEAALADGIAQRGAAAWYEHPQYLGMGGAYIRGLAMRRLPGHPVTSGWLAPLLAVQAECDIAVHIEPAPLGDALGRLSRRLRDLSAHRMLETERGVVSDVHVDVGLDSAYALRDRLARNVGRPAHLSIIATVRASNLDSLRTHTESVRLGFAAALVGVETTHFRHRAALLSTLPLGVCAFGGGKLVDSAAAATCMPWVVAECSDPAGYRLGASLRTGAPVRVAPFDTGSHANANIAVFAASGHGKSFALGTLVIEAAVTGVDAVVIDPEGEHRRLVETLGGRYLSLAPGSDAAVNVFEGVGDDTEEAIATVVDLVSVLCGDSLDEMERALVDAAARDAVARAAAAGRVPLLEDCLPMLETHSRPTSLVVRRFCLGALGALFNRPTSIRIDAGVCAISLRDMPEEHVAAATLIVARWLWELVRRDRRRRHIVFDEVGALCAHPPLRALLVQLARRCRKYGASLVVATQNAQDLLASDEGHVIATNCATVLLGGHRAAETACMERAFGLTEVQRRFLESAPRGEFLLLAGDRRVAMRVDVPDEYRTALSADPLTGG